MSAPRATDFAVANAQGSVDAVVKEDEAKRRVAVHTFDPDASPQQKGATAGKARDQVKSLAARDQDEAGAKGTSVWPMPPFSSLLMFLETPRIAYRHRQVEHDPNYQYRGCRYA